ncbi:LPS assembly lipoprotein LptE [Tatumella citrea]|uniref:LPS-assembly lipoprotein LptE n=1 Tax=Tatumella citrea TaxID=53336 RepID=A0A1Y0L5S3_TATCI|nr:LPS assembly lipoprotein LptE [Tatumella citrea]ARU93376.1 LPS biosynthesis protein [Tatumella citrea]ARU97414.1 LPS biosynthesis protein [Tatumella citrea]
MRQFFSTLILAVAVLATAGCGFHTRGTTQIPKEMQTMILTSSDPYGPLARTVRQELRLNAITLVDDSADRRNNIPSLRLEAENTGRSTASVFIDGTAAEYQLHLTVTAQVLLPGKGIYPLSTTVYRTFFDNSGVPLAKDSEQDMIYQEMRVRAADQLVRQLIAVHAAQLNSAETLPAPETITSHSGQQSDSAGSATSQ